MKLVCMKVRMFLLAPTGRSRWRHRCPSASRRRLQPVDLPLRSSKWSRPATRSGS